jgi:hypothetical protein
MAPIKGPFQEARADAEGHVFRWLNQPAGYTRELFAEFDRKGELLRIIALPSTSRIIAIGAQFLYAVQEMSEGTWTVRRYHRPQ